MSIFENIREGFRSIRSNMLRTVLTAMIITLGITALVGMLTAVDGIQSSVSNSFAGFGANSFDIKIPERFGSRRGVKLKKDEPIEYKQATLYREKLSKNAVVSISTTITGSAQVKFASEKTNPNTVVMGADAPYFGIKGYRIADGRNFSVNDLELATFTAIIGSEVAERLFKKQKPVNQSIDVLGFKFRVVGLLEKKGSITGGDDDRVVIIPLETARHIAFSSRSLSYNITTSIANIDNMDYIMGEATGLMRNIRKDRPNEENSFEVERADAVAREFNEITGFLRIGGFGIGFITLLGASIALMNIMMVSVTERTREIGIRKSLGATPNRIRQQFLLEAIVICIIGGIAGIILGIGVGNIISQLISTRSSFIIPWDWMTIGIVVCVLVGVFSGIYPAWKASKLDPIESLRYE